MPKEYVNIVVKNTGRQAIGRSFAAQSVKRKTAERSCLQSDMRKKAIILSSRKNALCVARSSGPEMDSSVCVPMNVNKSIIGNIIKSFMRIQ